MTKLLSVPAVIAVSLFVLLSGAFPAGIYEIKHNGATGSRTVTGVVSAVESSFAFFIADASAAYHGIYIYQNEYGPSIGDEVTVTGTVSSTSGRIQLSSITSYTVNSVDNAVYAPVEMNVSTLVANLDAYEGSLVKLTTPLTVTNQYASSSTWQASDGTGTVTINTSLDYNYFPANGDDLTAIAGLVKKTGTTTYQIEPRFTADLWAANDVIPNYALKGTVVTMDDSHNVFDNYYIWVRGDSIESITPDAPAEAEEIINVAGLIFPGLISTHDHPTWNVFDFIPFGRFFRERNDWADDVFGGRMYCDFKIQKAGFGMEQEVVRLTEVRLATGGGTVLQGGGSDATGTYGKLGHGIILGERFPGRIKTKVAGTTDDPSAWADAHVKGVKGTLHRYMPHLAETTDAGPTMANQWTLWKGFDSFDGRDTLIHGLNIPAADYALFDHGTDAFGRPLLTILSWACLSNMLLYDETADIPGALAQGAIVALAPDWTPSGMPNLLAELNFARSVDRAKGWNLETRVFIDMVTRNAAMGFGQLWRYGTIETGKMANLMVIDDGPGDVYDDLMMVAGGGEDPDYRGGPRDVRLTVLAGRPIYGDDDLLNTANFPFLWEDNIEDLTICGVVKKLKFARKNPGFLHSLASQPFGPMYASLWSKYYYSDQYPCDFLPVDPCGALPATPAPSPSPPPGTYIVSSSTDDASQHNSFYVDNTSYVYVGRHTITTGYNAGFRFTDLQLGPGRQIVEAYLTITQDDSSYNSKTPQVQVAADDADNSPTFSSGDGPLYRTMTDAKVDWKVPAASTDQQIISPDISDVIQEIVDRPGWNSGNAISIILAANEPAVDNRRRVWAYDGAPAKAAQLFIVDAPSPIPGPTPEICTRIDEGFDGFVAPDYPVPDGWTFSGVTESYTTAGDYGHLSPSLRFSLSSSQVTTPAFTSGEWLQFWVKGQGTDSSSNLLIEEEYYSGWKTLFLIQPLPTEGRRYTGINLHHATSQVRFTYNQNSGDLALDDVLIKCRITPTPTPVGYKTPVTTPTRTPAPTPVPENNIVLYTFTGNTLAPAETDPSVTASNFGVSPGSTGYGTRDTADWAALGSGIPYIWSGSDWDAASVDQGKYYFFTVTPQGAEPVTVRQISFLYRIPANDDGPTQLALYAGDDLVSTIDPVGFGQTLAVSLTGLEIEITEETTFKIVGWGALFDSGELRVDDIRLRGAAEPTPAPTVPVPTVPPTPAPTPVSKSLWIFDYNGDGTSDIAIFRPASGLWAVRGLTRAYFGTSQDIPVPGDYTGDGTTNIAIFRESSGLWAVRGGARVYFGKTGDYPVPGDYNAVGLANIGIFRASSGLWAIRAVTRVYFGGGMDLAVPGYYGPDGKKAVGIFRPTSGLWAIRGLTRVYFGTGQDEPVPGDYNGDGLWSPAIFRPASGLWALRGVTRAYFGVSTDLPIPGGYRGDGVDYSAIFRPASGLWAIRGVTRTYFGSNQDIPAAR